jgi:hypothetical protein
LGEDGWQFFESATGADMALKPVNHSNDPLYKLWHGIAQARFGVCT